MTIEELQAQLEAALTSIKGLEENNRALKAEKQTLQTEKDQAAAQAREAADAAAASGDDVEKVRQSMQAKYDRDIADRDAKLAAKSKELLVERATTEANAAMDKAGYLPGLKSIFLKGLIAEMTEGEDGTASIGGKAIAQHVADFAKTSEGKQLIKAPESTGADAKGGSGEAKAAWTFEASQKDRQGFRAWAKQEENRAQANELYKGWHNTNEDVF